MGLGPILRRHHWLALVAAAAARCVFSLKQNLDTGKLCFSYYSTKQLENSFPVVTSDWDLDRYHSPVLGNSNNEIEAAIVSVKVEMLSSFKALVTLQSECDNMDSFCID